MSNFKNIVVSNKLSEVQWWEWDKKKPKVVSKYRLTSKDPAKKQRDFTSYFNKISVLNKASDIRQFSYLSSVICHLSSEKVREHFKSNRNAASGRKMWL